MDRTYFNERVSTTKSFDRKIFVNQAGYLPESEKKAVVTTPCKDFWVTSSSGEVCFKGELSHFGIDENSQDDVFIADFSGLKDEGIYTIETDCGEKSLHFEISKNVYDNVFDSVMKAFYYLRCGCGLEQKHAGKFVHKPCHCEKAILWEKRNEELEVSGGWHDAGDYGRYSTAGACALAHILYAYKLYPNIFKNRTLNIPESDSKTPDILEECRVELEWLLKMQREDGAVYHKATTAQHAPFVMPEDDKAQMFVFPISTMATADFVAVCALASGIYREFDEEFADKLLSSAEKTAKWLADNPDFIGFDNPSGCNTGGYGESTDTDNRFWAWAEMFAITGDEVYHQRLKSALGNKFSTVALGYASDGGLGALAYLLSDKECDNELLKAFKDGFIAEAESLALLSDRCGYGASMAEGHYGWGSNMSLLKHGMIFGIADKLEGKNRFRRYAEKQIDYLLGVNATGYSYVTGCGEFAYNYPHLRPAHADGIEECIPGMVSGGANRYPCDPDAKILVPVGTPPMKCFADDVGCFSLNEITIYWNSPAVFTFAFVLDK